MKKQSGKNKLVINEKFIFDQNNINRAGIFPLTTVPSMCSSGKTGGVG